MQRFGGDVTVIYHDNYYKAHHELPLEERARLNYDHPNAFDTEMLVEDLKKLKRGQTIQCPVYDYTIHDRTDKTVTVHPARVIIVEGILIFSSRELCDQMDIKLYVDTDADVRILRRITRDVRDRGRSLDSVITQYLTTVKPMLSHPEELLRGIQLARVASGLDTAYFGIEKNKQDAIDLLNSLHPEKYGVKIVPEDVKYPQGGEKLQIKAITDREVKPGGLPAGVGCNVISTQTAYAIYRACCEGVPSYERIMKCQRECPVGAITVTDNLASIDTDKCTQCGHCAEICPRHIIKPQK